MDSPNVKPVGGYFKNKLQPLIKKITKIRQNNLKIKVIIIAV